MQQQQKKPRPRFELLMPVARVTSSEQSLMLMGEVGKHCASREHRAIRGHAVELSNYNDHLFIFFSAHLETRAIVWAASKITKILQSCKLIEVVPKIGFKELCRFGKGAQVKSSCKSGKGMVVGWVFRIAVPYYGIPTLSSSCVSFLWRSFCRSEIGPHSSSSPKCFSPSLSFSVKYGQ